MGFLLLCFNLILFSLNHKATQASVIQSFLIATSYLQKKSICVQIYDAVNTSAFQWFGSQFDR